MNLIRSVRTVMRGRSISFSFSPLSLTNPLICCVFFPYSAADCGEFSLHSAAAPVRVKRTDWRCNKLSSSPQEFSTQPSCLWHDTVAIWYNRTLDVYFMPETKCLNWLLSNKTLKGYHVSWRGGYANTLDLSHLRRRTSRQRPQRRLRTFNSSFLKVLIQCLRLQLTVALSTI